MRAFVGLLLVAMVAFATSSPICPPTPTPSYMDIVVDETYGKIIVKVYNISGNYDKMPIQNALVYRVNLSGMQNDPPTNPSVCYDVTDSEGKVVHEYNPNAQRCIDYWYIFCPVDANTKECLNKSGLSSIPQTYTAVPPCGTRKVPLQYLNYLPSHNEFYICNTPSVDMAPLCWPLMLIFSLLLGASFAAGRNPFSFFDFSAPRMGRGRQYSMRVQQKSFDIIQYIIGFDKMADTFSGGKISITGQLNMLIGKVLAKAMEFLQTSSQYLYFAAGGLTDAEKLNKTQIKLDEGKKTLSELQNTKNKVENRIRELESKQNLTNNEKKELNDLKGSLGKLNSTIQKVEGRIVELEKKIENSKNKLQNKNLVHSLQRQQVVEVGGKGKEGSEGPSKTRSKDDERLPPKPGIVALTATDIFEAVRLFFTGLSSEEQKRVNRLEKDMKEFMESIGAGENAGVLKRVAAALLFGLRESLNLKAFSSDEWRKTLFTIFLEWLAFRNKSRSEDFIEKLVKKIENLIGKDAFLIAAYINEPARLPLGLNIFQNAIQLINAEVETVLYSKGKDTVIIYGNIVEKNGKECLYIETRGGKGLLIDKNGKIEEIEQLEKDKRGKEGFLLYDASGNKLILSSDNKEVAQFQKNRWRYNQAIFTKLSIGGADERMLAAMAAYVESLHDTYKALRQGNAEDIKTAFVVERTAKERVESVAYLLEVGQRMKFLEHHISKAQEINEDGRKKALEQAKAEYEEKMKNNPEQVEQLKFELSLLEKIYGASQEQLNEAKNLIESEKLSGWIDDLKRYAENMVYLADCDYEIALKMRKGIVNSEEFSKYYNATTYLREKYGQEINVEKAEKIMGEIGKIAMNSNWIMWVDSLVENMSDKQKQEFEDQKKNLNEALSLVADAIHYKETGGGAEKKLETKTETFTSEIKSVLREYISTLRNPKEIKEFVESTRNAGLFTEIKNAAEDSNNKEVVIKISVPTEHYGATFGWKYNLLLSFALMTEVANNAGLNNEIKGKEVGIVTQNGLERMLDISKYYEKYKKKDESEMKILNVNEILNSGKVVVFTGREKTFDGVQLEEGKVYVAVKENDQIKIYENEGAKVKIERPDFIAKTGQDLIKMMDEGKISFDTIKNEIKDIQILVDEGKVKTIGISKTNETNLRNLLNKEEYKENNIYFTFRNAKTSMIRQTLYGNDYAITVSATREVTKQVEVPGEDKKSWDPFKDLILLNTEMRNSMEALKSDLRPYTSFAEKQNAILTSKVSIPPTISLYGEEDKSILWEDYKKMSVDEKEKIWEKNMKRNDEEMLSIIQKNIEEGMKKGMYSSAVSQQAAELKNVVGTLSSELRAATPQNYNRISKLIDIVKDAEYELYTAPSEKDLIFGKGTPYENERLAETSQYWVGRSPFLTDYKTVTDVFVHERKDAEKIKLKIEQNIEFLKLEINSIKEEKRDAHSQQIKDELEKRRNELWRPSLERRTEETWKKLEEESKKRGN